MRPALDPNEPLELTEDGFHSAWGMMRHLDAVIGDVPEDVSAAFGAIAVGLFKAEFDRWPTGAELALVMGMNW